MKFGLIVETEYGLLVTIYKNNFFMKNMANMKMNWRALNIEEYDPNVFCIEILLFLLFIVQVDKLLDT